MVPIMMNENVTEEVDSYTNLGPVISVEKGTVAHGNIKKNKMAFGKLNKVCFVLRYTNQPKEESIRSVHSTGFVIWGGNLGFARILNKIRIVQTLQEKLIMNILR